MVGFLAGWRSITAWLANGSHSSSSRIDSSPRMSPVGVGSMEIVAHFLIFASASTRHMARFLRPGSKAIVPIIYFFASL